MKKVPNPFDRSGFGVCVVDTQRGTIYQNESCPELCECPLQAGKPIDHPTRCMISELRKMTAEDGAQLLRGIEHRGSIFDLFYVKEGTREYFFLFPLEVKLHDAREVIEPLGLTDREKEIFSFLILGLNNERICARTGVSRNTLKSHLKAIYRKVPAKALKLLPQERLAAMDKKFA